MNIYCDLCLVSGFPGIINKELLTLLAELRNFQYRRSSDCSKSMLLINCGLRCYSRFSKTKVYSFQCRKHNKFFLSISYFLNPSEAKFHIRIYLKLIKLKKPKSFYAILQWYICIIDFLKTTQRAINQCIQY